MGLNAFGLLCDIIGFSSLTLGACLDLKRRRAEYRKEKIDEFKNSLQTDNNLWKQIIDEAKYEVRNYRKDRDKEKEDLLNQKEQDIALRDSYKYEMEDMQESISWFTDGVNFDPEEFDKETEEELKIKQEDLEELIEIDLKTLPLIEQSETIINRFLKFFKNTLTHLNEQMIFLKIGATFVILGFVLQFISAI